MSKICCKSKKHSSYYRRGRIVNYMFYKEIKEERFERTLHKIYLYIFILYLWFIL